MTSKQTKSSKDRTIRREAPKGRRDRPGKPNPAAPPVMARGYHMDVSFPANQSYTKKNRRRVDVPLSTPGAEIRLPSLPAFRASARWLSLALLIALLGALYFLWNAPFFQVSSVEVQGVNRVKSSDINTVLQVSGKPVFVLHPEKLQKTVLDAFPEFSSATVDVSFPNSVVVKVTEREPVLTWRSGGQNQLVDAAGFAFPIRFEISQPISPVVEASGSPPPLGITAEGNTAFLSPEMVAATLAISKSTPANVTLLYNPEHGFGWQDERGWNVYLGDDQEIEIKLNVYAAIVQRLLDEEIQPALISVEHVHNPYYRLEQ
jgi:cell division septal protein FtsQ